MTVIPITVVALGTVTKCFKKRLVKEEIRGKIEIIVTSALLRSARILRSSLRHEKTCCYSKSIERRPVDVEIKNSLVTLIHATNFLKLYKISSKLIEFILEAMKNKKVELTAREKKL